MAYLKSIVNQWTDSVVIVDSVGNFTEVQPVDLPGHDYRILGQGADDIAAQIPEDTELLLISVMFSQDWPYVRHVLKLLRERCPKAAFIAGGEHITAVPEFSMQAAPELDLCVLGEGEAVLDEILRRYAAERTLPLDVPGTWVRSPEGRLVSNPRQARIGNLQELPWPDWNGFPLENYLGHGHGFGVNLGRSMPIMATRGCPYQCTFCSSPLMWTTAWKAREPEDVLREMKLYMQKFGAENFDFYDLTAVIKKDWIIRFGSLLIAEKLNITWQLPSGTRSEAIDRTVAKLLYGSGCRNLSYAPESGSLAVLKMIKKKVHLPHMIESMQGCIAEGISVKVNIICGFPEERPKHLLETLRFLAKISWIGVDDMSINQFSPYPGSELFDDLIKANRLALNDAYFESLSYYSSMTHAQSYGYHLSSRLILAYKLVGTLMFYAVNFLRRPSRLIRTLRNAWRGVETTRMEKTLNSYLVRLRGLGTPPPAHAAQLSSNGGRLVNADRAGVLTHGPEQ